MNAHIVYDGRLGRYDVPKFARCPKCEKRVTEADRDKRVLTCAMTCPSCRHRWYVPMVHPTHCQNLRAPNDANGNPGRCWAVYGGAGELLDVIDEGYKGQPAYTRSLVQLPSVEIGHGELREWLRLGEELTGYREGR